MKIKKEYLFCIFSRNTPQGLSSSLFSITSIKALLGVKVGRSLLTSDTITPYLEENSYYNLTNFTSAIEWFLCYVLNVIKKVYMNYKLAIFGILCALSFSCLSMKRTHEEDDQQPAKKQATFTSSQVALIKSIIEQDTEQIKALWAQQQDWQSLLLGCAYALRSGKQEILKTLIALNLRDAHGKTILITAVITGQIQFVSALIASGADVNAQDIFGWTPLFYALHYGNKALVQLLLNAGASTTIADPFGYACSYLDILLQSSKKKSWNTMERLLEAIETKHRYVEGNAYDTTPDMHTAISGLMIAAAHGNKELVELFLQTDCDIDDESLAGSALILAYKHGQNDIVRMLLEKGAEINAVDYDEATVLALAAAKNDTEMVEDLIQAGADVNEGSTLHKAAETGQTSMVKLLLNRGADATQRGHCYRHGTPLHLAVMEGYLDTVNTLLEAGIGPIFKMGLAFPLLFMQ